MRRNFENPESQHANAKFRINIVVAKCCSISQNRILDHFAGMLTSHYNDGGIY